MKKKFNIDEIFREKLGAVETTPPADSWKYILAHLPEKKRRRIAPLWYKLGSIAAVIAILILFNDFFDKPISSSYPISVGNEKEIFNPDPTSAQFEKYMREAGSTLESITTGSGSFKTRYQEEKSSVATSGLANLPAGKNKKETVIKASSSSAKNKTQPLSVIASSFEQNVTKNSKWDNRANKTLGIHFSFQPLVMNEQEFTTPDLLAQIAVPVPREISENSAKREGEELTENYTSVNKFSLTTNAGAVYLGKFGKGNFLASQFNGLEDGGGVTTSFGVHLGYQLSNNLKIRSGLNKVDFLYSTQNVNYLAVLNSQAVTAPIEPSGQVIASSLAGSLDQGFGFIEIPVELEYALINKKIELNLIGGVSSFFLQENNVSFTSSANTADLGQARNINDLSFSANFGVGLNYHLSRQFLFNLEPLFKYQINTFNSSLDVNSYYLGIYSGLRFKF